MSKAGRIFFVFVGLLFVGAALFLAAINYTLLPGLAVTFPGWATETVVMAAAALFLLIAIILLSLGLKTRKKVGNAVLKGSEYGEVLISLNAVENMVLRVIQRTEGVKDVSRKVNYSPDGLMVKILIRVMPDLPLPEVISGLQSRTKEYLEEITGIVVQEVKVMVDNIITDQPVPKK